MTIYEIENLTKTYRGQKNPAISDINLKIKEGEIFGLLGENGAGKTTLIKQMVNLVDSTSGIIRFMGNPLKQAATLITASVGYMPQSSATLDHLTVKEALTYTARLRGCANSQSAIEADRLMHLWDIHNLKNRFCTRLSGGEKRLLQIAVAMANNPPVLILDEPTNELSPQRRKQVWDTLNHLNEKHKTTIIFITHDAVEAEKIIQRVGIISRGKLLAVGSPQALKSTIDQRIRVEINFSPETSSLLPQHITYKKLSPGKWVVYLDRRNVDVLVSLLRSSNGFDFRVYSANLEDLYLYYANK